MSSEAEEPRAKLHDEIAEILRASAADWLSTQEIADKVNARARYSKEDHSEVTAFQVHGRTRNYSDLFEREGSRVRLRAAAPSRGALHLNHLLVATGIAPAGTRLVRHRARLHHREVFDAALRGDPSFERYQETQDNEKVLGQFRDARFLAGFVADPMTRDTVFVGIWERVGERKVVWSAADLPAPMPIAPGAISFETRHLDALSEYRGRLVIDWGDGERAWVQRAERRDKPVLELRRVASDPPFPGFLNLRVALDQAGALPPSWADALRSVRGVYILVHARGAQYVGSAVGAEGFMGRWLSYADGHGGNAGMRELKAQASEYTVSILEVVGSAATVEDVYARESAWKEKLGTRAVGLNRN